MALQVWLPLNKDVKNFGLDNSPAFTNNGATLTTGGVFDKCYSFNGSSNYIAANTLTIDCSHISACAWVYANNSQSAYGYIISLNNGSGYSDHAIALAESTSNICFTAGGVSSLKTSAIIGSWAHLAVTFDGQKIIGYVNGSKIGELASTAVLTRSKLTIGARNNGGTAFNYFFNGKINDVRIYDHALSDEDVKRIYQKKIFDLVPYSGIKNILFDKSGLMIGKLVPYNLTYRPMCAYFNGSTSAIQIPPMTSMNDSGIFSMNVWFYKDDFGSKNWETIFGGPSGFELEMKPRTENTPRIVAYNWGQSSATGITYATKQWNMLTMTRTTSNSKFYLNGELKYTGNAASIPSGDYWVGSWKVYNSQNYNGLVGNFKLYRKELSAEEILKLYNTECNMFLPDEYEELEYIESTGTQWIDTGVKANQDTLAEIKFEITGNETGYGAIFGARTNSSSNCFNAWTRCGNGKLGYQIGNSGSKNCNTTQAANVVYNLKLSNGNITVNNDSVNFTPVSDFETPENIAIFNIINGDASSTGTGNRFLIGKVYSFKVYNSGMIVRNMFPSKRKSDNVIGMYDMVSRQFFTNSGTGSFTGA